MLPLYIQAGTLYRHPAASGSKLTANNGTSVIAINEADGYISFSASTTYAAGNYRYVITDSDGLVTESGRFDMLPSLASGDGRTPNQKILAIIDDVIAGRASQSQLSVSVGDKAIRYMTHAELLDMRSHYEELVDSEAAALSGFNNQNYVTRFK
jgi:hypothetical protein